MSSPDLEQLITLPPGSRLRVAFTLPLQVHKDISRASRPVVTYIAHEALQRTQYTGPLLTPAAEDDPPPPPDDPTDADEEAPAGADALLARVMTSLQSTLTSRAVLAPPTGGSTSNLIDPPAFRSIFTSALGLFGGAIFETNVQAWVSKSDQAYKRSIVQGFPYRMLGHVCPGDQSLPRPPAAPDRVGDTACPHIPRSIAKTLHVPFLLPNKGIFCDLHAALGPTEHSPAAVG